MVFGNGIEHPFNAVHLTTQKKRSHRLRRFDCSAGVKNELSAAIAASAAAAAALRRVVRLVVDTGVTLRRFGVALLGAGDIFLLAAAFLGTAPRLDLPLALGLLSGTSSSAEEDDDEDGDEDEDDDDDDDDSLLVGCLLDSFMIGLTTPGVSFLSTIRLERREEASLLGRLEPVRFNKGVLLP